MRWVQVKIVAFTGLLLITLMPGLAKSLTITANPFQYDGEYKGSSTPLLYLNARYLNQNLGIAYFITHDYGMAREQKALFDGDYNAFADNPIMNQDPSGHGVFPSKMIQDIFDKVMAEDPVYNDALQTAARFFERAEQESLTTPWLVGETVYIPLPFMLGALEGDVVAANYPRVYAEAFLSMNSAAYDSADPFGGSFLPKLIKSHNNTAIGRFSSSRLYDQHLAGLIMEYMDFPTAIINQGTYGPNTAFMEQELDAGFLGLPQIPRGAKFKFFAQFTRDDGSIIADSLRSNITSRTIRMSGRGMLRAPVIEEKKFNVQFIPQNYSLLNR